VRVHIDEQTNERRTDTRFDLVVVAFPHRLRSSFST
jgi:hypothetical protein